MLAKSAWTIAGAALLGLWGAWFTTAAPGAEAVPAEPSVSLYDAKTSAAEPLPGAKLTPESGWQLVPEDKLPLAFQGDVIIQNDRLNLVLRRRASGVELYSRTAAASQPRAVLAPLPAAGSVASLSRVQVLENTPAAVQLAVTYKTAGGGTCAMQYRLSAGQTLVEVRLGAGAERLAIRADSPYAIVPDFFGDDLVFAAETALRTRLRLPAENFFLALQDQGRGQLMCVWQASQQPAVALRSTAPGAARWTGYEIQSPQDKPVWVAVLEGSNLWHARPVNAAEAQADLTLAWKPPFPAKWRVDLLGSENPACSWYFRAPDESGESPGQAAESPGPCCLEGGRAVVRLQRAPEASSKASQPRTLLVYALDRNRATPLDAFCPIDVLRNTLGVGPCQYILQTEGLASDTNPTPDSVMTWVEKQFQRKKDKNAADEIREQLAQMVEHLQHAQARIARYTALAREVRNACSTAEPKSAAAAHILGRIVDRLEQVAAGTGDLAGAPRRASQLAEKVTALVGREKALPDCQKLGAELRALGAVQDRTLANCRMTVRWLKQSAAMLGEDAPEAAALAAQLQQLADQVLAVRVTK